MMFCTTFEMIQKISRKLIIEKFIPYTVYWDFVREVLCNVFIFISQCEMNVKQKVMSVTYLFIYGSPPKPLKWILIMYGIEGLCQQLSVEYYFSSYSLHDPHLLRDSTSITHQKNVAYYNGPAWNLKHTLNTTLLSLNFFFL